MMPCDDDGMWWFMVGYEHARKQLEQPYEQPVKKAGLGTTLLVTVVTIMQLASVAVAIWLLNWMFG